MSDLNELVLPSSPADRAKIKAAMIECSGAMTRIESEKDYIKEAVAELAEEYEVPKKLLNKLLRVYHKSSKDQVLAEAEQMDVAYSAIFENTKGD